MNETKKTWHKNHRILAASKAASTRALEEVLLGLKSGLLLGHVGTSQPWPMRVPWRRGWDKLGVPCVQLSLPLRTAIDERSAGFHMSQSTPNWVDQLVRSRGSTGAGYSWSSMGIQPMTKPLKHPVQKLTLHDEHLHVLRFPW